MQYTVKQFYVGAKKTKKKYCTVVLLLSDS